MSILARPPALAVLMLLALGGATACSNSKQAGPQPSTNAVAPTPPADPSRSASVDISATTSSASSATTSPATTAATASGSSLSAASTAIPSPSPSPTLTAAPTTAAPANSTAPPETGAPGPSNSGTSAAAERDATIRGLLVRAADLGAAWESQPLEDVEGRGEICGNAAIATKDRLAAHAIELMSEPVQGTGVHEVALYRPGTASAYAQAVDALLSACTKVPGDFDGEQGLVTATRTGPVTATYTIDYGGGVQTFGAIRISVGGDYVSTTTAYAEDTATAARIVTQIDAAARRTFASRKLT